MFITVFIVYQEAVMAAAEGASIVDETLLEGHLGITRELLLFQDPYNKLVLGSQPGGPNLIKVRVS